LAARVTPAIVNVAVTSHSKADADDQQQQELPDGLQQFFGPGFGQGFGPHGRQQPQIEHGIGSGVIISPDGYIVTNNHVIDGAVDIRVTMSNRKILKAKLIGADPLTDLAVIKVDGGSLPSIPWGDSTGLHPGQTVLAFGNPFGFRFTVTRGIVSALNRPNPFSDNARKPGEFIQTDAAINPGNSGGPLLNSHGEVIGINTMIASNGADQSSGIGFAIPINTAKAVLADLTRYGRVKRPSLGIVSYAIGPDLAGQMGLAADQGVLIQKVVPGGAADRAGLHGGREQAYVGNTLVMLGGDLIVAVDGQQVTDPQDINVIMEKHQAGDTISVTIYRGRKEITLKLILGEAHEANT
jgi:S1-C subfamily serine protease